MLSSTVKNLSDITMNLDFGMIVDIFTVIGVIIAIFVAFYTVRNDKKNLNRSGLDQIFKKINDPTARKARSNILYAYRDYLIEKKEPTEYSTGNFDKHPIKNLIEKNSSLKENIILLKADFEEMAIMGKNGMIDEEDYFDAYWNLILRCYSALHGNIKETRKKYGKYHMQNFEHQCIRAINYWRRKHGNEKLFFPE